jgi:hypothetical protein
MVVSGSACLLAGLLRPFVDFTSAGAQRTFRVFVKPKAAFRLFRYARVAQRRAPPS